MIEAKWDKKCPGCGESIYEGDKIGIVDGDWVCESCVDDSGGEDS
jgi:formylmethanofuran dehydrogenase subunit E